MTDPESTTVPTPYTIAAIIDGVVVDTITCDEHFWALYTSSPTFVDISSDPTQLRVGDPYSVE